jgi:hypothetical protein
MGWRRRASLKAARSHGLFATDKIESGHMKTGAAICAIGGVLFISVVSPETFWGASAQSGRVIPKPTPPPSAESPKQPEARSKFVADPDADKYKLVFPISSRRKIYKDPPKNRKEKKEREKEIERNIEGISSSYRNSFVEQLNKAGERGYRLIALGYPLIGVVRLGNAQHEYAWFETTSDVFFAKVGFVEKCEEMARQGFSVVDHIFVGSICDSNVDDTAATPPRCEYIDFYLLEREKGIEIPSHYRLARHVPRWREWGSEAALTTQINDYLSLGFNPTLALSMYEVLLRPITDKGEFLPEGTEVKVVTGNVKKKVNELAGQGYRLALTHNQIAVMYRYRDATAPVSYIWLDGRKKKTFEQELARLQDSGAIYRMTYPDRDGDEYTLIFEQPASDVGKRREYKVLKVEFRETENFADQKMDIELAPSSKETIKTLNSLVKEGFAVRDLFISDSLAAKKASVLLERTQ